MDIYAYHSISSSSEIEVKFCKDCGHVISQRILRPDIFSQFNDEREKQLLELLDAKGLLLCNIHESIPSVSGLGFSMENIVGLMNKRQVFYSKAYKNQVTFLSVKVYQLLKRCFRGRNLTGPAEEIYNEILRSQIIDKSELRKQLDMDKREFEKHFDLLLQNLKVTATSAKK